MANNSNEKIVLSLDIPKTASQINSDIKRLQKQLKQLKIIGELDTKEQLKQINAQIEALQRQINKINILADIDTDTATNNAQKAGQTVAKYFRKAIEHKQIYLDKLNEDIKTINNNLNNFSFKSAGYNKLKTDIKSIEYSLDSLKNKLYTDDNTSSLSSFFSQIDSFKSIYDNLKEINGIG